ncbi:hypothetical protein FXO38_34328 [Capsicum annuum]|uniref:cell division protein FtsZ isoform X2 n=1 Tax=Capsicum annuum TaxID=4072 RepID=UPI0007BF8DF7|nr:cell division protein FtsZ isoform X2 [Capsicum annuum]KAF3616779.1 hypothetical protein FXO38_34328 [Capsicum annuum]
MAILGFSNTPHVLSSSSSNSLGFYHSTLSSFAGIQCSPEKPLQTTTVQNLQLLARKEICKIKVVGVGGSGNNAVNRMIGTGLQIPGLINVDFADVKAIMKDSGTAMLRVGASSSRNRAEEAAEEATLAPLIGSSSRFKDLSS